MNEIGELLGIFTAKDVAFRIVGSGLNATQVTIDTIMTKTEFSANAADPAGDALNLMVERGFRHLPVLDENCKLLVFLISRNLMLNKWRNWKECIVHRRNYTRH